MHRRPHRRPLRAALAFALSFGAACSTIECAYDVRCRVGDEPRTLRLWIRPHQPTAGMYFLVADFLLAPVDVAASAYWAIADLDDDRVRTRGLPLLAPVLKLAAVALPGVSAFRDDVGLEMGLLGSLHDSDWKPSAAAAADDVLLLPAGTTIDAARESFTHWYARTPAQLERIDHRLVELEWLPARGRTSTSPLPDGPRPFHRE